MAYWKHVAVLKNTSGKSFPIVMLHYLQCVPHQAVDAHKIEASFVCQYGGVSPADLHEKDKILEVMKVQLDRTCNWDEARWKAYGWEIIDQQKGKL